MSGNRATVLLLYVSIYMMLIFPDKNLPQSMLELGSIHIYLFEIPLVFAYILSFLTLVMGKRPLRRSILRVYVLFIPFVFIGFVGAAMYAEVLFQTILKDFRPTLYWLSGITLVFIGHEHLRLKTLSGVVAIGALTQFLAGFLMVWMDPLVLFQGSGFRLPGQSKWLVLFFVSLFLMMITYKASLSKTGKYRILPITTLLIPLLIWVVLVQSRTAWIILFLLLVWWLISHATFTNKLKLFVLSSIFILMMWQSLQFIPYYGTEVRGRLYSRLFHGTLSTTGIRSAWEANREVIYKSNWNSFRERPIFGNGFGYQMYYDYTSYGEKQDRVVGGTDNSFVWVAIKTGVVGLVLFMIFIYKVYFCMKRCLSNMEFSEEWLYLKSMVFVFPFFVLYSLNSSILYGYPEVMIFSLFFAKAALLDKGTAVLEEDKVVPN